MYKNTLAKKEQRKETMKWRKRPLFQEWLLNSRPEPLASTLRGPNSTAAPYPIDEQPGPSTAQKH